jgi:hypothetical protein
VAASIPVRRRLRPIDQAEIFPCPTPNRGGGEYETTAAIFLTHGRAGLRRSARVYEITEAGAAELRRWLEETSIQPDRTRNLFLVRIFFGDRRSTGRYPVNAPGSGGLEMNPRKHRVAGGSWRCSVG